MSQRKKKPVSQQDWHKANISREGSDLYHCYWLHLSDLIWQSRLVFSLLPFAQGMSSAWIHLVSCRVTSDHPQACGLKLSDWQVIGPEPYILTGSWGMFDAYLEQSFWCSFFQRKPSYHVPSNTVYQKWEWPGGSFQHCTVASHQNATVDAATDKAFHVNNHTY